MLQSLCLCLNPAAPQIYCGLCYSVILVHLYILKSQYNSDIFFLIQMYYWYKKCQEGYTTLGNLSYP